jgi:hypothetical protein
MNLKTCQPYTVLELQLQLQDQLQKETIHELIKIVWVI